MMRLDHWNLNVYPDGRSYSTNQGRRRGALHLRGVALLQHLLPCWSPRTGMGCRLMCEARMCSCGIDAETVPTTLAMAEQHHCEELKDACVPCFR